MSNETTTVSVDDLTQEQVTIPVVIAALSERPGLAARVCREFNFTQPGAAIKVPKQVAFWGTPGDRGAGADTEFDGDEGIAAGNTQVTTDGVSISAPEYVVAHAMSDRIAEDSPFSGAELLQLFMGPMLTALTIALDADFVALLPSLSNGVGTSTQDMTLADALAATHGIVTRGANCDAMEYILDPEQVANLRAAVLTTNAAAAVYAMSADRLIGFNRTSTADRGAGREMILDGCLVTQSGLCQTADAGANVVGAAICPTTAQNDASGATTFGIAWKRLPRFETQRQAKARSNDLVMSMRAGLAELQDGSGTSIKTDAP
jgi:hypothetical protein